MKTKLTIFWLLLLIIGLGNNGFSQCSNCDSNYPSGTFSTTDASLSAVSDCMYGGEYAVFSVTSGESYTWTTCSGSGFDTQLTLFQGSTCGGTSLAYSDDDCGSLSTINWTATFTGTVTVLISEYSCDSNTSCMTLEWACTSCGGGSASGDCDGALPFCTSDSYTFPASTNVPNMGSVGCLGTTPNPAWYWMEINEPGNIDIYISSGGDVDFIAWGPFNSLSEGCATDLMSNSGVDCSYSTAATETCNLIGTQAGEVYILLITNYANIETNISFSQTAGSGTTNCGIIAPPVENNGPLCEGETLELIVSTPEPGATYSWTGPNGFTSSDINPTIPNVTTAAAGTYSLVITVGPDTSDPETTDVVVSPNVTPIFNAVEPYCEGDAIPALPTTSTNGVTGSWSPVIDNMNTTTYIFTPDAGQCALTTDLTIDITPQTTPTFNAVGPYCQGDVIPTLPTTSTNGVSGSWSPAINNSATATYVFTPDASECAITTSLQIVITPQTVPTFNAVGPYCAGEVISALPTTSTNGISGSWSPAINNMATSTYTFTPDGGQCATTANLTINITSPTVPTFDPFGPYCAGETISSLPTTSTNGVTGSWSPAINNLVSTTYTFTPTAGECAVDANMTITIYENPVPIASNSGSVCSGSSVNFEAFPDGMTSYAWNGPAGYSSSNQDFSLMTDDVTDYNGDFILIVTDSNGCTAEATTTLTVFDHPSILITYDDPLCYDACDGEIEISSSSSATPLTYSIDGGVSFLSTNTFTDLCAGDYSAQIVDANGCESVIESLSLVDPEPLSLSLDYLEDANCLIQGSAEVSASGGTPSYTYMWPFGVSNINQGYAGSIPAGDYTVTVMDANDCTDELDITVENGGELVANIALASNVQCFGGNDGAISLNISVGEAPYTIAYGGMSTETSQSSYQIQNLFAGYYNVSLTDANGCNMVTPVEVEQPDRALGANMAKTNVSCYGEDDGEISAMAFGGTQPYSYVWSQDNVISTSPSVSNLGEGFYHLEIHDANSCAFDTTMMIQEPSQILVSHIVMHPSCIGNNDGSIELEVTGGVEPYAYIWDDVPTSLPYLSRLYEGSVNVTVRDATNCFVNLGAVTLVDIPEECLRIPDAFTPNGDDTNDTWVIENIDNFPNAVVTIYNRWGQVVYVGKQGDEAWDGTDMDGKMVATGSFLYLLKLYNGTEPLAGIVSVIY